MIVYVAIGNSDDKLTQKRWAAFYSHASRWVHTFATAVHGQWVSEPASAWQNACWCLEVDGENVPGLRRRLGFLAQAYEQDSIAWAEAPVTEFIKPGEGL